MSTGIINAKMEHGYTGINLNFADEQYVFAAYQKHCENPADSCCAAVCHCIILTSQTLCPLFRIFNGASRWPTTTIDAGWVVVRLCYRRIRLCSRSPMLRDSSSRSGTPVHYLGEVRTPWKELLDGFLRQVSRGWPAKSISSIPSVATRSICGRPPERR